MGIGYKSGNDLFSAQYINLHFSFLEREVGGVFHHRAYRWPIRDIETLHSLWSSYRCSRHEALYNLLGLATNATK